MNKKFALVLLLAFQANLLAGDQIEAVGVEVDIHGMTCAFCVDAVQRNLSRLPDVEQVEVSLKSNRIQILTKEDKLDIERIKKTILDSGFTPMEVRVLNDE